MNVKLYGTAETKATPGPCVALIVLLKGNSYSTSALHQMQSYITGLGVIPGYMLMRVWSSQYLGSSLVQSTLAMKLLEDSNTFCVFVHIRLVPADSVTAAALNKYGRDRIRKIRQMLRRIKSGNGLDYIYQLR